jgi:hypothetical protein
MNINNINVNGTLATKILRIKLCHDIILRTQLLL